VNTGWVGGAYGVGKRMSIKNTRACIDAILDGSIAESSYVVDPVFGFEIPTNLAAIPAAVLDPRQAWTDKDAYDVQRLKLADMFIKNYEKYITPGFTDYSPYGPHLPVEAKKEL